MLHELLMALLGHTGTIIVDTGNSFELSETVNFLSRAERDFINKIVSLGWEYKKLLSFVTISTSHIGAELDREEILDENEGESGVYTRALCYGVGELLKIYREHILAIEHEYLLERALTIPHLIHRLGIFFQTLPALSSCVSTISEHQLKGGQLLDLLFECQQNGNPAIRKMFSRLVYHCLRVLYEQVNAWTIYGIIIDDTEEFFVQRIYSGENIAAHAPSEKGSSLNLSTLSLASTSSVKQHQFAVLDVEIEEWNTAYKLRLPMLATNYVTTELAEKILFIGKVVRVLQSKRTSAESDIQLLTVHEMQIFSQAFQKLQQLPEFNQVLFAVNSFIIIYIEIN